MAHFRKLKEIIRRYLTQNEFSLDTLPSQLQEADVAQWISPLIACLPEQEELSRRAAHMLGYAVAELFKQNKESARIIMRRLIWQMNEESGNIGWGIPLAFAECLAHSDLLATEYHRILISYIYDREGDSNYCDFAPLRITCFDAIELLLDTYPVYTAIAKIPLLQSTSDSDPACRQKAEALVKKYNLL